MADSIIKLREQGINSISQLDDLIKKSADDRQDLLDKIKNIETKMKSLSQDMENINNINKYREILSNLDKLQEKKNTLIREYSLNKEQFSDLVQYRKNYENYYGIEVER